MTPFAAALNTAFRSIDSLAGELIVYRRGDEAAQIVAVPGETSFEQQDRDGLITTLQIRDWLFPASALVLDDEPVLPKRGDRIEQTVGDEVHLWEVTSRGDGDVYRFSDRSQRRLRVHTIHIGKQQVE